jgi:hypothetical protein
MTVPVEYEERILLYVDILGWKSLVRQSEHDAARRDLVGRAIDHLISFHAWARHPKNPAVAEWQIAFASDSLFASSRLEGHYLDAFLFETAKLAHGLLREGVFLRGALVRGLVLHNKELIVGPGVVNAVELECKAITPRILVDGDVRPLLCSGENSQEFIYKGPHDKETSFDYLGFIRHRWQQHGCVGSGIDPDISRLRQVLARKIEQDANQPDPSEKEKLNTKNDWVRDYLANYDQATRHVTAR